MTLHTRTSIQTFSGEVFDLLNPDPKRIRILDIATHLSRICRFIGASRYFYSVAQHSVIVSYAVPTAYAARGLLHDAHEAYVGDVTSPLKRAMRAFPFQTINVAQSSRSLTISSFDSVEGQVERAVHERFSISRTDIGAANTVYEADMRALATEHRDLFPPDSPPWPRLEGFEPFEERIIAIGPDDARDLFLTRCAELGIE